MHVTESFEKAAERMKATLAEKLVELTRNKKELPSTKRIHQFKGFHMVGWINFPSIRLKVWHFELRKRPHIGNCPREGIAEALAQQVTQENFQKGLIYPPFKSIRKISAHIAANVADKAYELGLASHLPRPANLVKYAESCMYSPIYRTYR
ncbi:hypothetical protein IEQ34_017790 [Dendrobium chrysotoxum]|uniref:Malic enzyme NAD-binding domain-containing protein n=1 Tax=Dendrobium chrysotoxum TaxID=161865 RepID=A0AAV7GAK9_DENCH|nr:hypothetical protein IEQ34_017790 [Dendrobium chrysotoxum]